MCVNGVGEQKDRTVLAKKGSERNISKAEYGKRFPALEVRLGQCQRAARAAGLAVVIVFEGWDAAGKGTMVNRVTQALDPRGFKVQPVSAPTEEERLHPWLWRFWGALPPAGMFAIFDRSWYGRVLVERMEALAPKRVWQAAYEDIRQFERQVTDAGTVIIKFWLHIDKKEQSRRFKKLEKRRATAWKVGKAEREQHRRYGKWLRAVQEMLDKTGTAHAPWTVVDATQGRYRRVKVFETIVQAVEGALKGRGERQSRAQNAGRRTNGQEETAAARGAGASPGKGASRTGGRALVLDRKQYETQLGRLQERLFELEHRLYPARVPAVIVYEGCDAGGKGGNIRRLTHGLDPRGYDVVPVGPPTDEEKGHHYLWRFWRHVPKAGHITIFDRSWYGRVLVERVEGFCTEEEWKRAYREINEFERQLADFGTVMVKFWLQIDRAEQLRRFRERERLSYKRWKITAEDWRNRRKWRQYEAAVSDMLRKTSTPQAPWIVLEGNSKWYARVKALRTVTEALERGIRNAERRAGKPGRRNGGRRDKRR